ncbi:MAG: hypothetical protein GY869_12965 [Planctomycetes bacterium]|nr:hypothetical protein [Planctomycetota bacterium]
MFKEDRVWQVFLVMMSGLILVGCETVGTKYPLSAEPQPIDAEQFEGAWMVDDSVIHIHFDSKGVARMAGVEWDEQADAFKLNEAEIIVAEGDRHNYMSLGIVEDESKGPGGESQYMLLQYYFTEAPDMVIWTPVSGAFAEAVESGKLKGEITKGEMSSSVLLTDSGSVIVEFLDDPENGDLFEYREPMILRKITKSKVKDK